LDGSGLAIPIGRQKHAVIRFRSVIPDGGPRRFRDSRDVSLGLGKGAVAQPDPGQLWPKHHEGGRVVLGSGAAENAEISRLRCL
jgi:hypothetical protein